MFDAYKNLTEHQINLLKTFPMEWCKKEVKRVDDVESIQCLIENGYSIKKEWQDEAVEATRRIENNRTKSLTRLFKFFTFPIDYIESVYDFYRGNIMMAFMYLNEQARGLTQKIPGCKPASFPAYPIGCTAIPITPHRKKYYAKVIAPWSKLYGRTFEVKYFHYSFKQKEAAIIGPNGTE